VQIDSILNLNVKTIWPRKAGDGETTIAYICTFEGQELGLLNLSATDLSPINHEALLAAFKTIRLKRGE